MAPLPAGLLTQYTDFYGITADPWDTSVATKIIKAYSSFRRSSIQWARSAFRRLPAASPSPPKERHRAPRPWGRPCRGRCGTGAAAAAASPSIRDRIEKKFGGSSTVSSARRSVRTRRKQLPAGVRPRLALALRAACATHRAPRVDSKSLSLAPRDPASSPPVAAPRPRICEGSGIGQ